MSLFYRCFLIVLFIYLNMVPMIAQDTFSIVAVDPETGEIGSAGASCVEAASIGGVIILSGIIPGRGAINGQANICIPHINLNNGMLQMEQGSAPQEIIDWLVNNDACSFGNFTERQYGIVDFDVNGNPRSAAYTGVNTLDWAGHHTGPNYAIQGNILLGPEIIDSMQARFLSASGTLADKLMAALQGANVPGADSRCLPQGTSSRSAFLRVFKPTDAPDAPFLEINVAQTAFGVEPIDSVQVLFDQWLLTSDESIEREAFSVLVFPNPAREKIVFQFADLSTYRSLELLIYDGAGRLLEEKTVQENNLVWQPLQTNGSALYFYQIRTAQGQILKADRFLWME
ncbi:MAG: DUF1028 domain-containing protein [Bacteroidota bacterium]